MNPDEHDDSKPSDDTSQSEPPREETKEPATERVREPASEETEEPSSSESVAHGSQPRYPRNEESTAGDLELFSDPELSSVLGEPHEFRRPQS